MPSPSAEQHALAAILKEAILSRVEQNGMGLVYTARARWQPDREIPRGMRATYKPLHDRRVPVRTIRAYGDFSLTEAEWPKDNLHAARTPKLIFVLRLPTILRIADYELHCLPGHGVLVPSGIPSTRIQNSTAKNQELFQLMPYSSGLLCWLARRWVDEEGKLCVKEQTCSIPHSQTTFYLNRLVEEATSQNEHGSLVCDSLLKIILSLLHRELQQVPLLTTGKIASDPNSLVHGAKTSSIREAEDYIKRNLRKPLSIDAVARHVLMSRTIFTAQFHARTGKTFTRYVQDMRFEAACELLAGGDLAIAHVAAAVGLKPDRMRVLFRERVGLSPQKFREHSREPLNLQE